MYGGDGAPEGGEARSGGGLRLAAAGAALCASLLTGCGDDGGQVAAAAPGSEGVPASTAADDGVRLDKKLVKAYFPEFGNVVSVAWKGSLLDDPTAPGPSDVRVVGVVELSAVDVRSLRDAYTWRDGPDEPKVPAELLPRLPEDARWQVSREFTRTVTRDGAYSGSFFVALDRRTVVFDAVNPEKRSGG
ncbi:hypothetical protein [Streptomyces sp. TR02-1]|uniref:hypothetical protein n=1 Tax=Streptomyces sp. TR02-1 TaxID=3385977 RepID=UPI0039A204F8